MPTDAVRSGTVASEAGASAIESRKLLSRDALPGPRGLPFLGNTRQLHRVLSRWADEFGSVYVFRIANKPVLTIS
jgi:hypothetical protein